MPVPSRVAERIVALDDAIAILDTEIESYTRFRDSLREAVERFRVEQSERNLHGAPATFHPPDPDAPPLKERIVAALRELGHPATAKQIAEHMGEPTPTRIAPQIGKLSSEKRIRAAEGGGGWVLVEEEPSR